MYRWKLVAAAIWLAQIGQPGFAVAQTVSAPQPAALHSADHVRADFAYMYEGLKRAHFNLFENVSREDYDRLFDQMMAEIVAPETTSQVARRLQRFAAYGRIAHARVDTAMEEFGRYRAAGGRYLPLALRYRGRRAYLIENRSGLPELPEGAEILTIDGETMGTWFDRLGRHISADTDYFTAALFEFYFPRLLWLETGFRPAFHVTYRTDGVVRSAVVPARSREEQLAVERTGRLQLDPDGRHARMIEPGIAYLRPGPFYNNVEGAADMYDVAAFRTFIDRSMTDFIRRGAQALVIDLRDNPGGDNSFSDYLLAWIADRPFQFASRFQIRISPETTASNAARLRTSVDPAASPSSRMAQLYERASPGDVVTFPVAEARPREGQRFRGRVYLLIDRHSYSNTAMVAATVQDYGFGTVVGEETADLATTLGAMESFTLPNTGIAVGYPKALIVRPSGSTVRRGVVPDVPIDSPLVADASDPVLQQVLVLARSRPGASRARRGRSAASLGRAPRR
jgi:hypothetical protein